MQTIYAVIWVDSMLGIPLSLHKDSEESAVEAAKSMYEKGKDKIQHLRAVSLLPDSDKLITLWQPDA